ncbi:MAG: photosystem reaction center subunit H [Syntrophomonadaceae bacterium]|nr:photosystem reaction center subunit H [Syntrophomonadaceae bacterium]
MKQSQEIIGIPVFSVIDGREVGQVKDLVINPEEGAVEYLLVGTDDWYLGSKVLPFSAVLGIGAHAVTTESDTQLAGLAELPSAAALLRRGIKVKGTRVLTRKGDLLGVVSEYEVDESTGKITGVEFTGLEGNGETTTVSASQVLTFGRDVLVVDEKPGETVPLAGGPKVPETERSGGTAVDPAVVERPRESEATRLFIERQKQFLMGKKVIRDIRDDAGNILIAEGAEINEVLLELAEIHGKLMELSQNIK